MKIIDFNKIIRYNDWPTRLINTQDLVIKKKSHNEILREFGKEKWYQINELIEKTKNPNINKIEEIVNDQNKMVSFYKGKFYTCFKKEIDDLHLKIFEKILFKYKNEVDYIVELGAGYGSKILNIAKMEAFKNKNFIAGEITPEGQIAIRKIATHMGIEIDVGFCDISKGEYEDLNIPKNSLIFTSYSTHYTREFKKDVYQKLLNLNPFIIIHFEPIYEVFKGGNIHDLMCKKYIEINDYNTNLLEVLYELENDRIIRFNIQKNIIGSNPFLPISIIECKLK